MSLIPQLSCMSTSSRMHTQKYTGKKKSSLNYSKAECKACTQFRFAFYSNCHQGLMALRIFNTIL